MTTADPLQGFKYRVYISGFGDSMGFQKVSGLSQTRGETRWNEITETYTPRKLPGVLDFGDIVLSHGIYLRHTSVDVWFEDVTDALKQGYDGTHELKNVLRRGMIIKVYEKGSEYCREFHVYDAYPKAIRVGDFSATSSEVVIQNLVIAHEGYAVGEPSQPEQ